MNSAVLSSLIPVVLLIGIGYAAVSARLIRAETSKDLSTLVFSVLTPALLLRTMNTVHVERLDFKPVTAYLAGAIFDVCGHARLVGCQPPFSGLGAQRQ